MHELALSQDIVEMLTRLAAREGINTISRVVLEVGEISGVEPEALAFCFDAATRSTPVQGAELCIENIAVVGVCRGCAASFPCAGGLAPCPQCGAYGATIIQGAELRLKEFEGE